MIGVTYESVARTTGVSIAVHPVVSLPTPGPVPDELAAGADQHILQTMESYSDFYRPLIFRF